MIIRLAGALAAAVLLAPPALAQRPAPAEPAIAIVPAPASVTPRAGRFVLGTRTVIWADAPSAALGRQLARWLEPATGYALAVRTGGRAPTSNAIVLRRDASLARLGAEGYALDVGRARVVARAPAAAGLFYAAQTMRQLLPPEIFREAPVAGVAWTMPAASIEDRPRFAWRGGHLDVGRHFMPKEFVEKYIDLLALHKMNVFHWHLTEDQGWRLEIRKYPRLTEVGAWRGESLVGRQQLQPDSARWTFDGEPHGGYYTQADAREIVAYAKARFVTVVPEIEMPGHARAAIAAYPELGVTGQPVAVGTRWGVYDDVLNVDSTTLRFMQDVLGEVMEIFPGPYIHVGGDEAVKAQWKASPRVQARMTALGVADEHALQSWFLGQMDAFLTAHGRRLVGWDEILEGGPLAPGATVMSWRGTEGGVAAARAGHDVVMAPGSHTYFDHYQSLDTIAEPIAIGGYLPLDTVYAFEPVPAALTPAEAAHVLGAQAQLWTEYMRDPKKVEYMAFPRLCAFAEVMWTPRARRDLADFRARLAAAHLARLRALDVNYRAPVDAGTASADAGRR
ncbi:MAG: beta-N-acetylhexosaminidase [Gemmatimonadaceae bacterium]